MNCKASVLVIAYDLTEVTDVGREGTSARSRYIESFGVAIPVANKPVVFTIRGSEIPNDLTSQIDGTHLRTD